MIKSLATVALAAFAMIVVEAQTARAVPGSTTVTIVPSAVEPLGVEYVKAHYTKYEYEIPMRDGKKMFTAVYVPKDLSQTFPMLMMRTPYSVAPYGVDNYPARLGPSDHFLKPVTSSSTRMSADAT